MENKNQNKFEYFASLLHDKEESEVNEDVSSDLDFKATNKIYRYLDKVILLAKLSNAEDAWKKIEWKLREKNSFLPAQNFRFFRYAAILFVLVALAGITSNMIFKALQPNKQDTFIEFVSSSGEMKEVVLPDGSKVWMGANSVLKYNNGFGNINRDIIFNGEAMFEVVKDDLLYFAVKLDNASIKVYGTKFLVTDYPLRNKKEVVLLEGNIKYNQANQEFFMLPGERLTANRLTGDISKDTIILENYNEWVNGKVYFENNDLYDLVFLLEKWYGVEFSFSSNNLKAYKFTGVIKKTETLDYNINNIAFTNKVKFQKKGNRIIISNEN